MMRPAPRLYVTVLVLALAACATPPREALYPGAAALLPGTEASMNSAGFWIGRIEDPDRIILDERGVADLNARIRASGAVRDLLALPAKPPEELGKELAGTVDWVAGLAVYDSRGRKVGPAFLAPLAELMAMDAAGTERPAYAFLVRRSDLRVLPTAAGLFDRPGDRFIDNLQASGLEAGTPLVVLHRSGDGAWLYVATELASGWIRERDVAVADAAAFAARYRDAPSVIVVTARADLFAEPELRSFVGYARMGTRLVLAGPASGPTIEVSLPERNGAGTYRERSVWVDSSAVREGPRAYTARSVITQAFALLHAPYGWGGSFGEQDCSQFLCEVFSTVGVTLPRTSTRQAKVGRPLPGFGAGAAVGEKARLIAEEGVAAATLLRFPGHIMLYLGSVDGRPFAIHETWAYREKRGLGEITRLINRVAVSNLELGRGTERGSHLERLTDATVVTPP